MKKLRGDQQRSRTSAVWPRKTQNGIEEKIWKEEVFGLVTKN